MSKTLLLADDSSTIQRVVELTFAQEDIRVIAVSDGEQALKAIERDQPDIVLADVGMPRLDGYSVSSHVKTSPKLQHIPVLLLTGAFEPIDDDRARSARADGVLIKPFEPRILVTRVQELLEGARAGREAAAARADHLAAPEEPATAAESGPSHVVPAWYRPERPTGVDRPETPAIDGEDLDRKLAHLLHDVDRAEARQAPAEAPSATEPAPAPEPLTLELEHFTPVHGTAPTPLTLPDPPAPEPLELSPAPLSTVAASEGPHAVSPSGVPLAAHAASTPHAVPVAGATISLATAFSALLAAEQSGPAGAALPRAISERTLEDVVRKILLTDPGVRQLVLDAAEKMVKEEIERLTSAPEPVAEGRPETQ
jgi:CheY-like chemotaxis protein